jgi:hypothetical protein
LAHSVFLTFGAVLLRNNVCALVDVKEVRMAAAVRCGYPDMPRSPRLTEADESGCERGRTLAGSFS